MPEWKIGDLIENRYEIHKILRGGMGVVYICYDHKHRFPFALKTFQDRYFQSEQMQERFLREARTWIELEKHQNIVRAYYVENIQGKPYIILEYIANSGMEGADLGRWIRRGMEIPQVLNFAVQFCDGMDYAFKKVGMVHRDVKPGNILVTQDRVVKITDFGLVKAALAEAVGEDFLETAGEEAVSDGVSFTRTGALMGTPPYMSPEQCRNAAEVDIRSDIYAFGTVLYEMFTGRWVFEATTVAAFVRCHLYEPPPSPGSVVPGLPRNLETIVLRCLAKEPEQRYSNFALLREELAGIYQAITGKEIAVSVGGEALEAGEWSNKGASLDNLGRKKEALACLNRALDIDPSLAQAWLNKGAFLDDLGRHKEALVCYDHALDIDPQYADAWYGKGNSLCILERFEEALTCCDCALNIDPRHAKAWLNKGASLAALGRLEKVLACYDRALAIDPSLAQAWSNKGASLAALGHREEAIACFDRALAIDPGLAQAWLNKGASLAVLGRYEEAIACFDRALAIDPGLAQAWFNKGAALIMLRRFQEGLGCLTKVLEINPYDENAKGAIALCQEYLKQNYKDWL